MADITQAAATILTTESAGTQVTAPTENYTLAGTAILDGYAAPPSPSKEIWSDN